MHRRADIRRCGVLLLLLCTQVWPGGDLAFARMARVHLSRQTARAAARYGPQVEALAERRYGIHGAQLLRRLVAGESGDNPNAVSSAGARGRTQFMPGTRQVVLDRYGIDPWKNADQAVHAAVLHLTGKLGNAKGLEGYNPGDPSYTNYILSQRTTGGPGGRVTPAGRGGGGGQQVPGMLAVSPLGSGAALPASDLLASLGLGRQPVPSSAPPVPQGLDARARLPLPAATQLPESGGGPAPKLAINDLLARAAQVAPGQLPDMLVSGQAQGGGAAGGGGGGVPGGRGGKVVVAPGANRPGVPLQPGPIGFARRIAGILGETVHIGTGTNHNQFTVSGNVSDHWRGEAMDIPASGRQLVRLGQAALIAAGMPVAQARKQRGGAYRVHGKQIIFASNLPGYGDHTDHLHVGLSRRRG